MRNLDRRRQADDAGFSITELALYIVLLGIVAVIVATTMTAVSKATMNVTNTSMSANASQTFLTVFRGDLTTAREVVLSDNGTTLQAQVPRKSGSLCWETITWQFKDDQVIRGTNPVVDKGVTGGTFSVADPDGTLGLSDTDRSISYAFDLDMSGSEPQHIKGLLMIGPANQTGGVPCS